MNVHHLEGFIIGMLLLAIVYAIHTYRANQIINKLVSSFKTSDGEKVDLVMKAFTHAQEYSQFRTNIAKSSMLVNTMYRYKIQTDETYKKYSYLTDITSQMDNIKDFNDVYRESETDYSLDKCITDIKLLKDMLFFVTKEDVLELIGNINESINNADTTKKRRKYMKSMLDLCDWANAYLYLRDTTLQKIESMKTISLKELVTK